MRISDWSSDVCSSDLYQGVATAAGGGKDRPWRDQARTRSPVDGLAGKRCRGADAPRLAGSVAEDQLDAHSARANAELPVIDGPHRIAGTVYCITRIEKVLDEKGRRVLEVRKGGVQGKSGSCRVRVGQRRII